MKSSIFFVHDMRYLFYINYFDIAFNLFTSFGYFETEIEHVNALKTFRKSLKNDGRLVLDYFNSRKILLNLTRQEIKQVNGIDFHISKEVVGDKIIKTIHFLHNNKEYTFNEEVRAFSVQDFERLFTLSGFSVLNCFGDYALNEFDKDESERLIFICKKM